MSDINIGALSEAINDKADRDLNNTQPLADYVVDSQEPTAENNYTWYRLYKSGWVEQGGKYNNASTARDIYTTITLPVTMASSEYTVTGIASRNTGSATNRSGYTTVYTQTTTQIGIGYYGVGTSDLMQYINWEVKGMSAQI